MTAGLDEAILKAAAEWHSQLREAGADSPLHEAHAEWLRQDPRHRRAWRRLEKLTARLDEAPADIIETTLKKARASRRRVLKLGLIVVFIAAAATAGLQPDLRHRVMADHYTQTGEQKRLQLDDGSVLDLNTNTAIDIDFDQDRRLIHLRQGEIQVTTGKDQPQDQRARPFIISTKQGEIRALGTRFLVRREGGDTHVSVLEQMVEIIPAAAPGETIRLKAGQQVRFNHAGAGPIRPLTGHPAAWTRGQLIISNWPLGKFLDELSRYRKGVIRYDDASAALRISGAFHLNNTDALLDNLTVTLPIKIYRFSPYWIQVKMADGGA